MNDGPVPPSAALPPVADASISGMGPSFGVSTIAKKTVEVKLTLPIDVASDLDLLLFDPVRGKVAYGARSRLITDLLYHWLKDKKVVKQTPQHKGNQA